MNDARPRVPVDLSPAAVSARLREVSRLSELDPARRLDAKLDLSPAGISRRLRQVSELNATCDWLQRLPTPRR